MHIYQLSGEIEVTLQVAGIDDIDDNIRCMLDELLANIEFLWRIGGEGIGAREIDQVEMIAVVIGFAHLGIHGDTTIVAHTFVSTRSKVEEGSLSTVRIAHQRHVDDVVQAVCLFLGNEHLVAQGLLVGFLAIYYL